MTKNINKNEVEVVKPSTFGSKEVYNQFKTVFETRSLLGKNKLKAYGFMILSNIKFNLNVTVGDKFNDGFKIELKKTSYLKECLLDLQNSFYDSKLEDKHLTSDEMMYKEELKKSKLDRYTRFSNNKILLKKLMISLKENKPTIELIMKFFDKNNIKNENDLTIQTNAGGLFSGKEKPKSIKGAGGKTNQSETSTTSIKEEQLAEEKDDFANLLNAYLKASGTNQQRLQRVIQSIELDKKSHDKDKTQTTKVFKEFGINEKQLLQVNIS